jgi:hypothetical protein
MKKSVLVCFRARLDSDARASFASNLLKEKKNYNTIFLHDRKIDFHTNKLISIFKFNKVIYLKNIYLYFNLILVVNFFYLSFLSIVKLMFFKKSWLVNNFYIKNIYVGDLVYDQYARFHYDFKSNFLSFKLIKLVISTIFKVLTLRYIIKKNNVSIYVATSYSYASLSSLAIRVSTYLNIKTLMIGGNYFKIFKDYNDALSGFYLISKSRLEKFKNNTEKLVLAKKYLDMRLNGESFKKDKKESSLDFNELDAKRAFGDKEEISKKEFLKEYNIDESRPIFVLATHSFKDANHLYGKFLFDDFIDELEFILEQVKKNNYFHWFIKKHPMSDIYNETDIIKNILDKKKINNVQLIDNRISTKSILEIADRIFTSRGTIAIEYAATGKCAYTSSRSYYSELGFTRLLLKKKDLVNVLNFEKINKLNNDDIINASCALFIRKDEILRENVYNLAEPQRHIDRDQFLSQINKNINSQNKLLTVKKAYLSILGEFLS